LVVSYSYDPELAAIVPLLPRVDIQDVSLARTNLNERVAQLSSTVDESTLSIKDYQVTGHDGDPEVTVRAFRSQRATGDVPALLYIHGGGFVLGSVASEQDNAATLASTLDIVVASVEYRLAPEHPFPAGLHDCFAALNWLCQHADDLGVDRTRVGVYGSSAGGGLAAALALYCRDRGGPSLCFQFLAIPVLDDRLATHSMRAFLDTPEWDRPSAELSWAYYLGASSPAEVSEYAAPARARDLRGLPPAYVSTMEFDPLRDEGILYALALLDAGVPVELHSYPGTFHGSTQVAAAGVSRRIGNEQLHVLRRALGISATD
jgi:acetyl esterase/lipase